MRKGKVFVGDYLAGIISEKAGEFTFEYDKEYLLKEGALPVSLTLPLSDERYVSKTMFAFFDGLRQNALSPCLR